MNYFQNKNILITGAAAVSVVSLSGSFYHLGQGLYLQILI